MNSLNRDREKPLTEERLREIIREEIAKIPPTYVPVPYPAYPVPQTPQYPDCPQSPWINPLPRITC